MHIANWFHHLTDPHCPDCIEVCETCEVLKKELEIERSEKQKLLQVILDFNKPPVQVTKEEIPDLKPIGNRLSWTARRQLLEQEDLRKSELEKSKVLEIAESKKSVEQLEKELLGEG